MVLNTQNHVFDDLHYGHDIKLNFVVRSFPRTDHNLITLNRMHRKRLPYVKDSKTYKSSRRYNTCPIAWQTASMQMLYSGIEIVGQLCAIWSETINIFISISKSTCVIHTYITKFFLSDPDLNILTRLTEKKCIGIKFEPL